MSEQGDPTPRRALPPRDDAADTPDDDSTSPRRGQWSATRSAAEDAPGKAATPIPPPAVLPVPDIAPASAGRRFSAVDLPADEERPLPRRSALSPAATRTMSPTSPATGTEADAVATGRRSHRKLGIGIVVALVVAAVAIGAFVLLNPGGTARPGASAPPTVDPVATYLLQPADLDTVRPDSTWTAAATVTTPDASTPAPKCVAPVLEATPRPTATLVRTFSPVAGAAAGILHQVETYASPEDATAAYAARVTQLGACERNTAWVQSGEQVTGLGDEATGSTVVLQGEASEFHTIIVERTGTRLNVVDATQAQEPLAASSLVPALQAVLGRQCADNGTCPASPAVAAGVPPVTEPPGFLANVDLPRITPGAGAWRGAPVSDTVSSRGSRCEALDLTTAPAGSLAQRQLTLVLQDDAKAPPAFGVDEVLYTFSTPEEAGAFAATLAGNIDGCPGRTGTAAVARTADLTGPGTGPAWVVTRKVDESTATARFRVAVVTSGTHTLYLMANPTGEFDFSDAAWHGVALRAAERLTQLP